jgi:hypothetical protein
MELSKAWNGCGNFPGTKLDEAKGKFGLQPNGSGAGSTRTAMDTFWNICCAVFVCVAWFRAGRRTDRATPGGQSSETNGKE